MASGAASAEAPAGERSPMVHEDRLATAVRMLRSQVFATVVACFDLDAQATALWSLQRQGTGVINIVETLGNTLEATFARTVVA